MALAVSGNQFFVGFGLFIRNIASLILSKTKCDSSGYKPALLLSFKKKEMNKHKRQKAASQEGSAASAGQNLTGLAKGKSTILTIHLLARLGGSGGEVRQLAGGECVYSIM